MALSVRILGLVGVQPLPRRLPLRGLDFLNEESAAVRAPETHRPRLHGPRLHARDLFGLLKRHFMERRRAAEPRCLIRLDVMTPTGKAAVKVLGANRLVPPVAEAAALQAQG